MTAPLPLSARARTRADWQRLADLLRDGFAPLLTWRPGAAERRRTEAALLRLRDATDAREYAACLRLADTIAGPRSQALEGMAGRMEE